MTILEAIKAKLSFPLPISAEQLNLVCADLGLRPGDEYEPSLHKCKVNAAAGQLILGSLWFKTFSEGGLTYGFDSVSLDRLLQSLQDNSCGWFMVPVTTDKDVKAYYR